MWLCSVEHNTIYLAHPFSLYFTLTETHMQKDQHTHINTNTNNQRRKQQAQVLPPQLQVEMTLLRGHLRSPAAERNALWLCRTGPSSLALLKEILLASAVCAMPSHRPEISVGKRPLCATITEANRSTWKTWLPDVRPTWQIHADDDATGMEISPKDRVSKLKSLPDIRSKLDLNLSDFLLT